MTLPIAALKRRYKVNLALGRVLPLFDLPVSFPLSTGNPLYDAALTEKLVVTQTLSEAEHLRRGWDLVHRATAEELHTLGSHARLLLNDFKLLLAMEAWDRGDEALTRQFLQALPWHWRLGFPTAVIKPSAQILTGWRRSLRFRLVSDPRFPALRELFRELLAEAPPVVLLKYRETVHQAAALLRFRFEGERELALHDWCFGNGRKAAALEELAPLPAYLAARDAAGSGGPAALARALAQAEPTVPLTSIQGLLGSLGIELADDQVDAIEALRTEVLRSATPVEALLSLSKWSGWISEAQVAQLCDRIRGAVDFGRVDLPFPKVMRAFQAAPTSIRSQILKPLFLPLMHRFGRRMADQLPPPGPITLLQGGYDWDPGSFLLAATVSSAAETRLQLVRKNGVETLTGSDLVQVEDQLAGEPWEFNQWLQEQFGSDDDEGHLRQPGGGKEWKQALEALDPAAPLLLGLSWCSDETLLPVLIPFQRVFNLHGALGAPGELSLSGSYYSHTLWSGRRWTSARNRFALRDHSALRLTEVLDRLEGFQQLAAAPGAGDPGLATLEAGA